jgi:hypothetical protein
MTRGNWKFKPASDNFKEVSKDWDSLNEARGNLILLDSRFVSTLLEFFGKSDILLGIEGHSTPSGMALVMSKGRGIWETFQPSQAPLGLLVFGYADVDGAGIAKLVKQLPGHALELSVLQQDPDHSSFPQIPARPEIENQDYIRTARVQVSGAFEEYWKSRGSNLRHNLSRQRRRIEEKGQRFEVLAHRCPERVAQSIGEYAELESKGWKVKTGTAITLDNAQGKFYRRIFEQFSGTGEAVIYQLLLDGKVAACDLCLIRGGIMVILKTTYDEAIQNCSPTQLMRQEMMRQIFADGGIHTIEFYGRLMDWHTKWTDQVRTMYHVNCFRHKSILSLRRAWKRLFASNRESAVSSA